MSDAMSPLPEVEFSFDGGGGGWRPIHVHVMEGVSRLYECSLLLANHSLSASVDELFGKPGSLEIQRGSVTRAVRGVVRRVEDLGTTGAYHWARVAIVPSLYHLSQRTNSRIWQDVNILTVIQEVFRDAGIYQGDNGLAIEGALDSQLAPREYCVQHRETDLAFVMRLLESEGVGFYFRHDGSAEQMVLIEDGHNFQAAPLLADGSVQVGDAGANTSAAETVTWFDWHTEQRSTGMLLRDFNFTRPRATLDLSPRHPGDGGARPVYDYPAGFNLGPYNEDAHTYGPHLGAKRARVRFEELQADAKLGIGRGNVVNFGPGASFTLAGHVRSDLDRRYVVLETQHHGLAWADITDDVRNSTHVRKILEEIDPEALEMLRAGGDGAQARYFNRFEAIPAEVPFRPERLTPRSVISGPQTALVVAPPGEDDEEIATDFHGRILVKFHWDRMELRGASQREAKASCWIRVSQAWAGAAWGAIFIPRVGMEVVVNFLDGDPDRPLVTGCVYNGENNTPYPLPSEKTKSGIKTSSSKGGQGFNELRFEDLADNEQIWVHAQRDHDTVVRHDQTLTIGRDRTKTVQGMEHNTVQKDRVTAVQQNDSLEVEGNHLIAVHGGQGMSAQVDTNFTLHADKTIGFTVGDSSIVMSTSKITINAATIEILGGSLINQYAPLVKINCSDGEKQKVAAAATIASKALDLRGIAGGLLAKAKDLLDPAKLSATVSSALDKVLKKVGVPDRIRERLDGLAKDTVTEVVSSFKAGKMPNFSKIAESAITGFVGDATDAAFKHLEALPVVKNSKILSGLVKEVKAVTKTSASYGILRAVGIRDGLAKDPFFTVLKQKHSAEVLSFLKDTAYAGAVEKFNAWVSKRGLPSLADKIVQAGEKQLGNLIDKYAGKLLLPAAAQ